MWYDSVWWSLFIFVIMLGIAIAARKSYVHYLGKSIIDEANKSESFVNNMAEAEMARFVAKWGFIFAIIHFFMYVLPKLLH